MNFNMNFIICCILKEVRSDFYILLFYCFFFFKADGNINMDVGGLNLFLFLWISFDCNKPFIDMNMRFIVQFDNLIFILFQTLYRIYTIHKNIKQISIFFF